MCVERKKDTLRPPLSKKEKKFVSTILKLTGNTDQLNSSFSLTQS